MRELFSTAPATCASRSAPARVPERGGRANRAVGERMMTMWTKNELRRLAETDDLHIAPFREDGRTYGTPMWIWSVPVDGDLYVRPYNGKSSRWYQAAPRQRAGRITAAGMTKDVPFEPVDRPINDRVDDAYRAKYGTSPTSGR